MAAYSPDEIIARLQAGEDPAALTATLVPANIRAALHYAAPLRWLTVELWETFVRRHAPTVSLDELRERDLVQELPREPGRYVLDDATRATYLAQWDPGELQSYSAGLAKAFPADGRERLYHLLLADMDAAVALFEELLKAAEAHFDLVAARNLLDLFERPDRRQVVDESMAALLAGWRAQIDTRAAWSTDYFRSAGFLERTVYRNLLEELLAGKKFRALQLVAMGGMGKTMMIRSFLARRCIPARIFVARIDFDEINPVIATKHPWLVRIALAQQLNEQSPDRYFESMLTDWRRMLPALYTDVGRETSAALRELTTLGETLGPAQEVSARYEDAMKRLGRAGSPVVFMFDTLEVPVLRSDLDASSLVTTLLEIYRGPGDARLLLAGRYDISKRIDGHAAPGTLHTVQLEPFTEAEARTYLAKVRGIDRPEIIDAILAKRDLMPFTLALYGDLACLGPELTAADVESFDDPKQQYLIERVLERIDDKAVLYALRYGVVARRLDKRFLEKVLMPYIEQALLGKHIDDNPELDPHDRLRARFRIEEASSGPADSNELWLRLASYASNQSWVSFVQDVGEFLSFHPNVREPMTLVLERQEVLRGLHERAFLYFRSLMSEQPHRLVQWAEEAAYHVFQARGPGGEQGWQELLAEVERVAGPAARGDLATALTADTDLTATRTTDAGLAMDLGQQAGRWFEGQRVMSAETLAEAHLEVALALLRAPGYFADLAWSLIEGRLSTVKSMEQHASRSLVDPQRRAAVQIALQARDGNRNALDSALVVLGQAEDPVVLEALEGVVLSYAGSIGTTRLAALADRPTPTPDVEAQLRMLLASLFLAEGDATAAEIQASHAATILGEHELTDFRVWLALTRGAPTEAGRLLAAQPASIRVVVQQGRAALLAQQPESALEASRRLTVLGNKQYGSTVQSEAATAAVVAELQGRVSAAWGDTDAAVRLLDEAASRWRDAGDLFREADARTTTARILLDAGRVLETGRHLEMADRASVPKEHDLWVTTRLVKARWLDRIGRQPEATSILDELVVELDRQPRGPTVLARVAVEGLASHVDDREPYLRLLAQAVSSFHPPDAALAALDGIDRCAPVQRATPQHVTGPLVRLLSEPHQPYAAEDETLRSLRLAELARVLGHADTAAHWLKSAVTSSAKFDSGSLIILRILETAARLRLTVGEMEALAFNFAQRHSSHPAVALDALIAWATASHDMTWVRHIDEMFNMLERTGGPSRRNAEVMKLRVEAAKIGRIPGNQDELKELVYRIYQTLGDSAALLDLDRLPHSAPAPSVPKIPANPWRTRPPIVNIRVSDEDRMLTVETETVIWQEPSELVTERKQAGSSWLLSDDTHLLNALRRSLDRAAAEPGDIRLRIMSPQLAELPWELAWPPNREKIVFRASPDGGVRRVMRVQRALSHAGYHVLADGVMGPQSEQAIRAYQQTHRNEASDDIESSIWEATRDRQTALVLELSHKVQVKKRMTRTTDAVSDYELAGFETVVVQDPTSQELSQLKYPCSLVHVQASLESRGDSACLSFDSGRTLRNSSEYGLEVLSVTALHDILMRLTTGLGPIVVLEAVATESRLEIMRQVLLRNLFASQLFDLGYASAVLATGPTPYNAGGLSTHLIAPALFGTEPGIGDIGELYRQIRQSQWDPILREYRTVPALFAEEPAAVRLL
ncbi:peptidoglycan-binding domain-containing protein [Pseudarthrobacter sulfonivorans]|uniref:peptidoglycan-binding domain-containing protein n=1 Tax=Pseudarthrobacter sulfonivorans TaxID=121292 RepID=UPI0027803A87|nr:peptidoglycan-binding domain-containing protein [Pseudarthrobacter sulfonivorans]MDQ0000103.1 tetratricopeptide (TPR) repeat protein [Pseudarthrobacter sulfonivorans]